MTLPRVALKTMGDKGREWMARDFSWGRIARRYARCISLACSLRGAAAYRSVRLVLRAVGSAGRPSLERPDMLHTDTEARVFRPKAARYDHIRDYGESGMKTLPSPVRVLKFVGHFIKRYFQKGRFTPAQQPILSIETTKICNSDCVFEGSSRCPR